MKYECKLASNIKEDRKSFFQYIKGRRETKIVIGPLENEAGKVIIGNKEMAEELNSYFASIFMMEDTSGMPELQENQGAQVSVVAITKEKVLGKLKGLKVDKSPGLYGLHPKVLKEIAEEIVEALG